MRPWRLVVPRRVTTTLEVKVNIESKMIPSDKETTLTQSTARKLSPFFWFNEFYFQIASQQGEAVG